jgi:hypothetical protein
MVMRGVRVRGVMRARLSKGLVEGWCELNGYLEFGGLFSYVDR